MSDLVFDQRKCVATLRSVVEQLLAEWTTLSPPTQQGIEAARRQLCATLPNASSFERTNKVIQTLQTLEAIPEVAALCRSHLSAGKGSSMRLAWQISDQQIGELLTLLATPAVQATTATPVETIAFQLQLTVAERTDLGVLPVIVGLIPDQRPAGARVESIELPFPDLRQPVMLELRLSTPGLEELTHDWTRTLEVRPLGSVAPAIFLIKPGPVLPANEETAHWLRFDFSALSATIEREIRISSSLQAKTIAPASDRGPTRGVGSGEQIDFFTAVDFPAQVQAQGVHPLVVRMSLTESKTTAAAGQASLTLHRPLEWLEVRITPTGLAEQTDTTRRLFRLYRHADSQPAVFLLQAGGVLGDQRVALDFYHQGRLVLSTALTTTIVERLGSMLPSPRRTEGSLLEALPANPPPPPDLELRILFDPQTRRLRFKLNASNPELGYQDRHLGEVMLTAEPHQVLQQTFRHLSELAQTPDALLAEQEAAAMQRQVIAIGQRLFLQLFPPELQAEYWRLKALREAGKVKSLLIISDEPWMPWELVKPYHFDDQSQQEQEDDFLAVAFHLARWLPDRAMGPGVAVNGVRLVAPALDLVHTKREVEFFTSLGQRGLTVGAPIGKIADLFDLTEQGGVKLLHLAAHGSAQPDNVEEAQLELEENQRLRPADLVGSRVRGLRRERPLVFLNACHSAQQGFALTGLGGWAKTMIKDVGASAFVGALWEVNDQLAAQFAIHFYTGLIKGQALAPAFHNARLHLREQHPANPTWLAYTLYADPNAWVTWPGLREEN